MKSSIWKQKKNLVNYKVWDQNEEKQNIWGPKTQIMKSWFPHQIRLNRSSMVDWDLLNPSSSMIDWNRSWRSRRWGSKVTPTWRLGGIGGTRLRVIEHNIGGGWSNRPSCDWKKMVATHGEHWRHCVLPSKLMAGDIACCRRRYELKSAKVKGSHFFLFFS